MIRLSLVLLLLTQLLVFPRPTAAQGTALHFADLGYGDRTAFGIDAVLDYYFPIPTGLRPLSDGRLTLRFYPFPAVARRSFDIERRFEWTCAKQCATNTR